MAGKKNMFEGANTDAAVKAVTRDNAEKQYSKIFKVDESQDRRIKEAMYLSGRTLKDICVEGVELWIAANLKGKM